MTRQLKVDAIEPAVERRRARAAPGTDRPHRHSPLPRRPVPVRLHQGHGRGHDAGCRKALDGPPGQQQRQGRIARGEDDQKGSENPQAVAHQGDTHPAHTVGEATHEHDEQAREERRDRDGEVHLVETHQRLGGLVDGRSVDVREHAAGDRPDRTGEQPEGQNAEDDTGQEPVVAFEFLPCRRGRLSGCHDSTSFPRWARAATTMASVPASSVGWIAGAK